MTRIRTILGNAIAVLLAALALAHLFVHPGANGTLVMGIPKAPAESVILAADCDFGGRKGGIASLISVSDSASVFMDTAVIRPQAPATPSTLVQKNGTNIHDLGRNLGGMLAAQGGGHKYTFLAQPQVLTVLLLSPDASAAKGVGDVPARADPSTDHSGMPLVIGPDHAQFPCLAIMSPMMTAMPTTAPTSTTAVIVTVPTTDAPMAQGGPQ